jgi:RNA polymerase sigma-70 factor (ECF subfamily)
LRQSDDGGDFEAAYRSLYPLVARTAYLIVFDWAVAQEIVQEAFGRYWQHRDQLGPTGAHKAWLVRVAVNLAIDHRRGIISALRQRVAPPDAPDPGDLALTRIEIRDMRAALLRVSKRDRAILALRFEQDLSFPEIGQILGAPEGTVRTQLHRALDRLRHELRGDTPTELAKENP